MDHKTLTSHGETFLCLADAEVRWLEKYIYSIYIRDLYVNFMFDFDQCYKCFVTDDHVMTRLLDPMGPVDDRLTVDLLQKLCRTLADVIIRQCKDQLPGGKFWNPSADLIHAAQATRAHNMRGERVFAVLDSLIHTQGSNEMVGRWRVDQVMGKMNRTNEWLSGQNTEIQETRHSFAKKDSTQAYTKG